MQSLLLTQFHPIKYTLEFTSNKKSSNLVAKLHITGRKMAPPSKRISLHQKSIRITNAKIIHKTKKGPLEHEIIRINYLPTFQEVRIHTKQILYPGEYEVVLEYRLSEENIAELKKLRDGNKNPSRELLPSIDEPEAWAKAFFEIKQ